MTDLTSSELDRVSQRISRVLRRFGAMPTHALHYRLGEVGQNRVEPHMLTRALAELANNTRPRKGQAEPGPRLTSDGLYVDFEVAEAQAEVLSGEAMKNLMLLLERVDNTENLAQQIATLLDGTLLPNPSTKTKSIRVARDLTLSNEAKLVRVDGRGQSPVHVWVTHEPDWLYPNDSRLWEFLEQSLSEASSAMIVARKIPLITLTLFKALGLRGTQFYATLVAPEHLDTSKRIQDALGWSRVSTTAQVEETAFVTQVRNALRNAQEVARSPQIAEALEKAIDQGFSREEFPSVRQIIEWWESSGLDFPRPAHTAMQRWAMWADYEVPTRRLAQSRQIRSAEPPSDVNSEPSGQHVQTALRQDAEFGRKTEVTRIPIRGY